jgi:neutral ceramidase
MSRAGFAKGVLTPPLGVELCGYGIYLERRVTSVHDDLFVRALLLEDDAGERVLLLTLDLAALGAEVSEAIVHRAAQELALPRDRVLLSCTHTHSAPAAALHPGFGSIEPSYVATIPDRCTEASVAAAATLRPVQIGTGHGIVRSVGMNRARVGGPLDPTLHVVRIDDLQGAPQIVLFSYGCHPVTIDHRSAGGTGVSADWPGQVARRLAEEGCGEAMLRLGACGDVDPVVAWRHFAFEGMELSAEVVAQSLLALVRTIQPAAHLRLRVAQTTVALPLQPLTRHDIDATLSEVATRYGTAKMTNAEAEKAAWQRFYHTWAQAMHAKLTGLPTVVPIELRALLLNEEAWLHLPGELFTAHSLRIQERSPFPMTVVTTLADRYIGYIPDREDFTAQGYASSMVPLVLQVPPYQPTVGEVLVDGAARLLETLASFG